MPSEQKIRVMGHVGREPELKVSKGGKEFVTFSVAASDNRRNAEGQWERGETTWYRVLSFQATESILLTFHKGLAVCIEGKPLFSAYLKDGEPVPSVSIMADRVMPVLYDKATNKAPYGMGTSPQAELSENSSYFEDSEAPF